MAKVNTYFQDEVIEKKIDMKQLARTLRYVVPYRKIFLLVGVLMFVSAGVSLVSPLLIKEIINNIVVNEDYRELALVIAGLVVLAAVEIAITFVHQRLMGRTGHRIIATIREDIFDRLQKLSFSFFDTRPNGKIVVRVTDYINDLANFFTNHVLMFAVYIIKLLVVSIFMIMISPQLTAIVYIVVVPMMICVIALRYSLRKMFAVHRAKISNRTAFIIESIMGEKIVKNYNRTEENEEIYMDVHHDSVSTWMKICYRNELNTPIVEIFWNLGTLCLYGFSLYMILNGFGNTDAGTIVAFTSYMGLFSGPLTQIAFIIQQLASVSSNLEHVFDTIDYPVDIKDSKKSIELNNVKGKIDFDHVTFSYEEGNTILEDFNLHVEPGTTIALVGPTGGGKTTIINMLTRFYDVDEGSVRIDGADVRNVTLASLRKEVGVLMQDPFIFQGSIIDNIRYGREEATDEECIEAAKKIYADKYIERLSGGYHHMLEKGAASLSAGEKQLISFARIILKNPSVIILDEATSAIDTETEMLIKQALDVIIKDKTAFIVAHRLSTIRNADRILYIADKGIKEQGTHEELMKLGGLYYQLNV